MANIPNIFHFVFGLKPQTEPFHLAHYLCLRSCWEVNKPEAIYFHCHYIPYGEWWEKIIPLLTIMRVSQDNFVGNYQYANKDIEKYRYAHSSDVIRLEALLTYGGIYADIDTLFVNPIPREFFHKPCVMGLEKADFGQLAAKQAGGSLCNAWIAAEKNAMFIQLWLKEMTAAFDGSWSAHSTFLPYQLSQQHPQTIHIEPERSFFYFDWTKKGLADIFTNKVQDTTGIYSMHLWSHLWWDAKRTDFTLFNNERLTTSYVKYANTTYATIARQYLPADSRATLGTYLYQHNKNSVQDIRILLRKAIKRWKYSAK